MYRSCTMSSSHLIFIVSLIFCFGGTALATSTSLNIAVNINSETKLTCTGEGSCENVNWYKSVVGVVEPLSLFQGNKRRIVDPSYTLAGDYNKTGINRPNCELHIKDITMLHAGRYYCQRFKVDGGALPSIHFYVSVVETSFPEVRVLPMAPDSETTATTRVVNGQLVSLTCSVTYYTSNDFSVIMEYSIPGISLPPRNAVIVGTTAFLYENISVTQDLSRRNFQCKFHLRGNSSFGDSNIIEMESQLPEVQMPYPPANITVGNGRDTPYYVDEEITCTADALPLPYYIWNKQGDNLTTIASRKSFTCNDSTAGSEYVCVASNTQGFIRSTPIKCEKKSNVIVIISVVICSFLLVAIIIAIVVVVVKKCKQGHNKSIDVVEQPLKPIVKPVQVSDPVTASQYTRQNDRAPFVNASSAPDVVQNQPEVIYAEVQDNRRNPIPKKPQRGEPRQQENIYAAVEKA